MPAPQNPTQVTRQPPGGYINPTTSPLSGLTFYPYAQDPVSAPSNLERKRRRHLRNFTRTPIVFALIQRITRGVLGMRWWILPPIGQEDDPAALLIASWITRALQRPNHDLLGGYRHFVSAIVDELLTVNECYVERAPGYANSPEDAQVFWAWAVNSDLMSPNRAWTPQNSDITPQFYFSQGITGRGSGGRVPLFSSQIVRIIDNVNTWEYNPMSALEVAYNYIEAWLGLSDYQQQTTSNASSEMIVDIGDVSEPELQAFREYWDLEVRQGKKKAIGGFGGNLRVVKAGANTDEALYLKYCDFLMRIIALCFALTNRDANITEHDNRATADASADSAFANAIKPVSELVLEEGINQGLVQYFYPGYRMIIDYREPRSDAAKEASALDKWKSGLCTRDEARLQCGESLLPEGEGDVFIYEVMAIKGFPAPAGGDEQ